MSPRSILLGFFLALTGCGNATETPPPIQIEALQSPSASINLAAPEISVPRPALWTASDADTTFYLFGSLHVLPESLEWSSPKLETALDKANAVYFETDVDPPPASLSTLVSRLGLLTPPERLSDHLSADERKSVARAAGEAAMSMYALEAMRPWLAAVSISQAMIERTGLRSDLGVERVLHARARASGKDIRRLESLEEQLRALSDLPERVQIRFLIDGVSRLEADIPALVDRLGSNAGVDIRKEGCAPRLAVQQVVAVAISAPLGQENEPIAGCGHGDDLDPRAFEALRHSRPELPILGIRPVVCQVVPDAAGDCHHHQGPILVDEGLTLVRRNLRHLARGHIDPEEGVVVVRRDREIDGRSVWRDSAQGWRARLV